MANPQLVSSSPADNASAVAVGTNIVLTYDQTIMPAGRGVFEIHRVSDESLVMSFAHNDHRVSYSTNSITVNPDGELPANTALYVSMNGMARSASSGDEAAGLSTTSALNFTTGASGDTADTTAPVLVSTAPADDAGSVPVGSNIVLTFNETIASASGVLDIRRVSDESLVMRFSGSDTSRVSVSGNTITFNPTFDLPANTALYVTMNGVAIDPSGNKSGSLGSATAFNFTTAGPGADTTPPFLTSTSPADNQTDVARDANIVLTFNETIVPVEGWIDLRRASDEALVQRFTISSNSTVVSGNTVTLNPGPELAFATDYYVTMTPGTFKDLAGNDSPMINSATGLNFRTESGPPPPPPGDQTPPVLQSMAPADNSTNISPATHLTLTFSETILRPESGVLDIRRVSDESLVTRIGFADPGVVTYSGNTILVNPAVGLPAMTTLYVTMQSPGKDADGNRASGISNTTSFNFTTGAGSNDTTAPSLVSTSPADNSTSVPVNANLVLTYNETMLPGSGVVELHTSNGALVQGFAIDSSSSVVSGSSITLDPSANLAFATSYYVTMSPGTFQDSAGNNAAKIGSNTTFNFTTGAAPAAQMALAADDGPLLVVNPDGSVSNQGSDFAPQPAAANFSNADFA
jgi:methionine-rich copper-binding protein CopC